MRSIDRSDWTQHEDDLGELGDAVTEPEPTRRECIAAVQHKIWAHWMRYLIGVSDPNPDGSVTISASNVTRWWRQVNTPYSQLSQSEQASDLRQADKVLEVL